MAKKSEEQPVLKDPREILGAELKAHEKDHLNFVPEQYYKASTGSLNWDIELGGGLTPGVHRFLGPPESGKSSAALEVCRNFLLESPNRRGLYIKAEGKLSHEMQARCGIKFVTDFKDWENGTVFVLESNIYEFVVNIISKLLTDNEAGVQFCIIMDSTDGMILRNDAIKDFDENAKVAGTPLMTKRFLQKLANGMAKRGHLCLLISQFSSNIVLDSYAKAEDKRPQQGGGGWGAAHFAHFVFEFLTPFNKDDILEKPAEKPSKENRRIGKRVNVRFKKSTNERTGVEVAYPVRFGVIGGSSVWKSLEIVDLLQAWGELRRKGAWYEIAPTLLSKLAAANLESTLKGKSQLQGEKNVHLWLEENPAVVELLYSKFKDKLTQPSKQTDAFQETKEPETL